MVPHPSLTASRDISQHRGACNADVTSVVCSSEEGNSFANALQQLEAAHNQDIAELLQEIDRLKASSHEPTEITPRNAGIIGAASQLIVLAEDPLLTLEPACVDLRKPDDGLQTSEGVSKQRSTMGEENLRQVKDMMTRSQLTGPKDNSGMRDRVRRIISNGIWFDIAIGGVIFANAVTIGIETQLTTLDQDIPVGIRVVEYLFLLIYTFEFVLRFFAFGKEVLQSRMIQFDLILLLFGVGEAVCTAIGTSVDVLEKAVLLRVFRLTRLARVLRTIAKFKVLWLLVQGLLSSILTLMWTFAVILILLYVFAVIGLELIRPDPDASNTYNVIVHEYFDSLPGVMLTLLQVLMLDSVSMLYRPIIDAKPYLFVYFLALMLLGSVALMNLVTAMMVESSIQQASADRQMQMTLEIERKKRLIQKLYDLFIALDTDKSGELDFEEILRAPIEAQEMLRHITNTAYDNELKQIFITMDYDDSGSVGINEFCEGLLSIQDGKPLEMVSIHKQCKEMLTLMKRLQHGQ